MTLRIKRGILDSLLDIGDRRLNDDFHENGEDFVDDVLGDFEAQAQDDETGELAWLANSKIRCSQIDSQITITLIFH